MTFDQYKRDCDEIFASASPGRDTMSEYFTHLHKCQRKPPASALVITQNFVLAHFIQPRSGLLNLVVGATHDSYHYYATVAERRLKHTPSQQTL